MLAGLLFNPSYRVFTDGFLHPGRALDSAPPDCPFPLPPRRRGTCSPGPPIPVWLARIGSTSRRDWGHPEDAGGFCYSNSGRKAQHLNCAVGWTCSVWPVGDCGGYWAGWGLFICPSSLSPSHSLFTSLLCVVLFALAFLSESQKQTQKMAPCVPDFKQVIRHGWLGIPAALDLVIDGS